MKGSAPGPSAVAATSVRAWGRKFQSHCEFCPRPQMLDRKENATGRGVEPSDGSACSCQKPEHTSVTCVRAWRGEQLRHDDCSETQRPEARALVPVLTSWLRPKLGRVSPQARGETRFRELGAPSGAARRQPRQDANALQPPGRETATLGSGHLHSRPRGPSASHCPAPRPPIAPSLREVFLKIHCK